MSLCISKMGQMPQTLIKTRKCITEPHASVHFQNRANAKNADENEKKCKTRPHASVHFENAKTVAKH